MIDNTIQTQTQNLIQELRRGVIVLEVLSQLDQEQYGYSLMKLLEDQGMQIDQGTLYPLLRRLEKQGLLASDWRVDGPRPRRYYIISLQGEEILHALTAEWRYVVEVMDNLL